MAKFLHDYKGIRGVSISFASLAHLAAQACKRIYSPSRTTRGPCKNPNDHPPPEGPLPVHRRGLSELMKHRPILLPTPPTDEAQRFSAIYQFYYQPLLLLGFLACSWWTSNAGVLAMADWISGAGDTTRQIALLVTASAMGAQYALWHYAMRLIPRYATYQAKSIGVLVVAVLMVMLALSSTYTSFIGLSQDSARGLELQRQADEYAAKAACSHPAQRR